MTLSRFDISENIKDWTDAFRTLSYRKHIHFTVSVEPSEEGYVMIADAEKMERITYNMLSNAFKFTPENGTIEIKLSQFTKEGERWLRYQVSDTGIGMPAEHVKHIFESFYQIDVHHAEGRGTVFTLEVPVQQNGVPEENVEKNIVLTNLKEGAVLSADQETIQTAPEVVERDDKETVLIIDDNQDVRDYVKSLLHDKYTVIEASNGQEGLQQAMKYVPDAVICDVMMPVMDGLECCRKLKMELQTSHIPVMLLTACSLDEQRIQGFECGADSYISKPFNSKLLLVRLRNLIDNHKRLKQFFGDKITLSKESVSEVDKGFVERFRELIEANLTDSELSVEELGSKMGLSRVQLYRKIKALTNYSPNELVRIARLKKAASLLASSEKTISEITYEVGFTSPSYFTKCYKEYFGESPTDFLKRRG